MKRRIRNRTQWLAGLSTRELVIILMELGHAQDEEPGIAPDVSEACAVLRRELLRRECPVAV
ncbi:MAG TPA: hypothetical protein VK009_10375 [Chloroflexota bacterium]|nr:hypothetical protein [Chloroflexota bacterium]